MTLADVFKYHAPKGNQTERYAALRQKAHELAALITELVPAGREQQHAVDACRDASMWANAGIAIGERDPHDGVHPTQWPTVVELDQGQYRAAFDKVNAVVLAPEAASAVFARLIHAINVGAGVWLSLGEAALFFSTWISLLAYDKAVAACKDGKRELTVCAYCETPLTSPEHTREHVVTCEMSPLAVELQKLRADVADAAHTCAVAVPEPGSDAAKLLHANMHLDTQLARAREALAAHRAVYAQPDAEPTLRALEEALR